jgi:glyoxylase-like metal-dependent hydrolase (beta-lactamase superfamily II)
MEADNMNHINAQRTSVTGGASRARKPDPTAVAVAPGTWMSPIPFPSALAYSYSYLLRVPTGVVVIDLGWDSDEAWEAFLLGLRRAGADLDDVVGAVVTHCHPDHYGFASTLKEHTGAWIAAHPAERSNIAADAAELTTRVDDMYRWLRVCGVPDSYLPGLGGEVDELAATMPRVVPDIQLADGDPVPDTDSTLIALHTPGHTAGHLCFHDRSRNLLFTGDHLLPRVTPNVSKRPGSDADPLADYVASLEKVARLGADPLVLPGHEWSFDRPDQRVAALLDHHAERLDAIVAAVTAGAETAWEVVQAVSWSRPFPSMAPRAQRQAIGETYSHLHRLTVAGRLTQSAGDTHRWAVVAPAETRSGSAK